MQIPPGHQTVMPYLILKDAAGFIEFTRQVFNAVLRSENKNADGSFGHCELAIGECAIMFSNNTDNWPARTADLFVYVPDADQAFYTATGLGSLVLMPPADQPYGRSAGVMDANGNHWWITSL